MPSNHMPSPVPGATVQTDCPTCYRFHDGDCPPPPVTVTLPVSGHVVPAAAAELVIKPTGSMSTRDGEAFSADVFSADGKTRLGQIEQDGHGGGTDFYADNVAAREMFEALVNEYAAISADHRFIAHEALCNDLYEEVALARDLNRKRNAVFRVVGEVDDFGDRPIYTVKGKADVPPEGWARIASQFSGKPLERWVKGTGWVAVEVSA